MQLDGPGLHYIRRSYRKQAASIAQGNLKMLTRETPEAKQVRNTASHLFNSTLVERVVY